MTLFMLNFLKQVDGLHKLSVDNWSKPFALELQKYTNFKWTQTPFIAEFEFGIFHTN